MPRPLSAWAMFVRDNYDAVRHLPNKERLGALSDMYFGNGERKRASSPRARTPQKRKQYHDYIKQTGLQWMGTCAKNQPPCPAYCDRNGNKCKIKSQANLQKILDKMGGVSAQEIVKAVQAQGSKLRAPKQYSF